MSGVEGFDRHRAAEMLASNPLFALLLQEMKDDAVATWKRCEGVGQREEMWMRYRCIEEIERRVESVIAEAKLQADRYRRAERREAVAR
jgi:hypothetical protein